MAPPAAWQHEAQQWQQEEYPQWAAQMRRAISQTRAMRRDMRNDFQALDRDGGPDSPFKQLDDAISRLERAVEKFGSDELISGPRGGRGHGSAGGGGTGHGGRGHGHGEGGGGAGGGHGRNGRPGGGGGAGHGGHAAHGRRGHAGYDGHGYGEGAGYAAYGVYESLEYGEQEPMEHERGRRHGRRGHYDDDDW